MHYFNRDDLLSAFGGLDIVDEDLAGEAEDHGNEGRHTHLLRYIRVRKM